MKGIYVNDDEFPYSTYIVNGKKTVETRTKDVLGSLKGERIAIIRTKKGEQATVVGYVRISRYGKLTGQWLNENRNKTFIPVGSTHDIDNRSDVGKYCYFLEDAKPCDHFPLPKNVVRHGRSWVEFDDPVYADFSGYCVRESCKYEVTVGSCYSYFKKWFDTEWDAVVYANEMKNKHPSDRIKIEKTETLNPFWSSVNLNN